MKHLKAIPHSQVENERVATLSWASFTALQYQNIIKYISGSQFVKLVYNPDTFIDRLLNMNKKIGLIVGHSEKDQGAYNKTYGISEYAYNTELARLTSEQLVKLGFEPRIFLRTSSINQVVREVNSFDPKVAISFHSNAFNTHASGSEVLYYHSSTKSEKLASLLQEAIVSTLDNRDRGLKAMEEGRGTYVLKHTKMPCALIEPFFIDNDLDYLIAASKLDELATAIANSVKEFFA